MTRQDLPGILKHMSNLVRNLSLIQVAIAVILIIAIAAQNKGAGLSNVFGGTGALYRTKRGFEKWLFYATIALAIIFVAISIAVVFVHKS